MAESAADKPWCMWPLHPSPACPNDNMSIWRQALKPMQVRRACRSLAGSYQDDGDVAANPITAYRVGKFRKQWAFWPTCTAGCSTELAGGNVSAACEEGHGGSNPP